MLGVVPHAVALVQQFHLLPFQRILAALVLANAVIDRVNNGGEQERSSKRAQGDAIAIEEKEGRVDLVRDGPTGELAALFDRVAEEEHHFVEKCQDGYQPAGRFKPLVLEKRISDQDQG